MDEFKKTKLYRKILKSMNEYKTKTATIKFPGIIETVFNLDLLIDIMDAKTFEKYIDNIIFVYKQEANRKNAKEKKILFLADLKIIYLIFNTDSTINVQVLYFFDSTSISTKFDENIWFKFTQAIQNHFYDDEHNLQENYPIHNFSIVKYSYLFYQKALQLDFVKQLDNIDDINFQAEETHDTFTRDLALPKMWSPSAIFQHDSESMKLFKYEYTNKQNKTKYFIDLDTFNFYYQLLCKNISPPILPQDDTNEKKKISFPFGCNDILDENFYFDLTIDEEYPAILMCNVHSHFYILVYTKSGICTIGLTYDTESKKVSILSPDMSSDAIGIPIHFFMITKNKKSHFNKVVLRIKKDLYVNSDEMILETNVEYKLFPLFKNSYNCILMAKKLFDLQKVVEETINNTPAMKGNLNCVQKNIFLQLLKDSVLKKKLAHNYINDEQIDTFIIRMQKLLKMIADYVFPKDLNKPVEQIDFGTAKECDKDANSP